MNTYHLRTPDEVLANSLEYFREVCGHIIMELKLYADDSGYGEEEGVAVGSRAPSIGGYIATKPVWKAFSHQWHALLKHHNARSFHYVDWTTAWLALERGAKPKNLDGNQYGGWDRPKLEAFFLELSKVIGANDLLPVYFTLKASLFHGDRQEGKLMPSHANRFDYSAYHFIRLVRTTIAQRRPEWKNWRMASVFDRNDDRTLRGSIENALLEDAKEVGQPGVFTDQTSWGSMRCHFPLQAADMYVYRVRKFNDDMSRERLPKLVPADEYLLPEIFREHRRFQADKALQEKNANHR